MIPHGLSPFGWLGRFFERGGTLSKESPHRKGRKRPHNARQRLTARRKAERQARKAQRGRA